MVAGLVLAGGMKCPSSIAIAVAVFAKYPRRLKSATWHVGADLAREKVREL